MANVSFTHATGAYRDATRIAEKIVSEVGEGQAQGLKPSPDPMKPSFDRLVGSSLQEARDTGYHSEGVSTKSIANEAELHDLVTSVANAELTLNTVVAVRDRVINAYQDIIKMPI
ncbi:MAG: flagellar hook-basal body complex protein FliE [Rickettsiales bacterium]|nr:flagellar hook-basal body complex protein FliE [Rickettsiales bacterium]